MTTAAGDPVDDVVVAFVAYLEGEGPRPSLDHLKTAERAEAEECIRLLEATYGTDPRLCPEIDTTDPVAVRFGYVKPAAESAAVRTPRRRRRCLHRRGRVGKVVGSVTALVALVIGIGLVPFHRSGALAMTSLREDCPAEHKGGRHIEVAGVWGEEEKDLFGEVLSQFARKTGISVTFANGSDNPDLPNRSLTDTLRSRIAKGCPPDVALLPQPGLLRSLAEEGVLRPLQGELLKSVERNYAAEWRALAEVGGTSYGVWFKAASKTSLWYSPAVLEAAGVTAPPPTTFDGLVQLANHLSGEEVPAFSLGGADGWTLTDWFEVLLLRSAGPETYQQLATHKIPWTDGTVRTTLETMARIFSTPGWTTGGIAVDYESSVNRVFGLGVSPKAAMVLAGDYAATQVAAAGAHPGVDARSFEFPSMTTDPVKTSARVVGGDVAVRLTDNSGGEKLLRFLAEPRAAKAWIEAGGFLSPNRNVDLDWYKDPATRQLAKEIANSPRLNFDLSDLQPPSFGATVGQGMWGIFQDFYSHPDAVQAVMDRLEAGARQSRAPR